MLKLNHKNLQNLNHKNKSRENICLKMLHNLQISDFTFVKSNHKNFNSQKTTLTLKLKHHLNQNLVL